MIIIAVISSLVLTIQDVKTKTIHIIPLFIFMLSMTLYHGLDALNIREASIVSLFFICLKVYEYIKQIVYLGLGDVIMIITLALIFSQPLFYIALCLSSMLALMYMAVTKSKIIPFVPPLLLSFWSVFIYDIFLR
jgi:hypothetical protein